MKHTGFWGCALFLACSVAWNLNWNRARSFAAPSSSVLHVQLCTSVPLGVSSFWRLARGIDNAATLASEQWRARFYTAHLQLLPPTLLDDAAPDGSAVDPHREHRNAQICAKRSDTFGYVGPLNSPVAPYSMPLLNHAGLVQVSPGNTLPILTSPVTRAGLEPATYHGRLHYPTYYRTITTDALEGPSAAAYLKERLGARSYFLVDDQLQHDAGVAGAMKAYAQKIGLQLVGVAHLSMQNRSTWTSSLKATAELIAARHPEGVLYSSGVYYLGGPKVSLFKDLRRNGYVGPVVGVDPIVTDQIAAFITSREKRLFGTISGADIRATSRPFRSAYTRRFHIPLQQFDASAYDAANIVLHAIYQAAVQGKLHGTPTAMRAAVLPYVAKVRWHGSIGVTSFDRNGDTRNTIVSVYRVRARKWAFAGIAPRVRGISPAG